MDRIEVGSHIKVRGGLTQTYQDIVVVLKNGESPKFGLEVRIGDGNQRPRSALFNNQELSIFDVFLQNLVRARLRMTKMLDPDFLSAVAEYLQMKIKKTMEEEMSNV